MSCMPHVEATSGGEVPVRHALDDIFRAACQPHLDRTAKIKTALDDYMRAVEQALVAQVAERLGVEGPPTPSRTEAADLLVKLVLDLPELKTQPAEQPAAPVFVHEVSVPSLSSESCEAGPEARELWQELNDLDLTGMSIPMFKAVAAHLAARARVLQDRGDNAELIPVRVIKKLTAIAGERHITGIYGLARYHQGDWRALAEKANAEIERLRNGKGLTQKLQIPAAILAKVAEEAPSASQENEDDEQIASFPRLQVAAQSRPIVLVGGLVVNEKLDWIKKRFGFLPEWIETDGTVKGVQSLEGRILDGRITAVVILEGLGGHKHFEPIVAATRQTGAPLVYGDTAGSGSLKKAFSEIEKRLLSAK